MYLFLIFMKMFPFSMNVDMSTKFWVSLMRVWLVESGKLMMRINELNLFWRNTL